jgi:ankyrin repeat protein
LLWNSLQTIKREFPRGEQHKDNDFNKEIENCCRENLISLLKYFIEHKRANLTHENLLLIIASKYGNKDIVAYLIEKGIDINQQNKKEEEEENKDEKLLMDSTALTAASENGHKEVVQLLLDNKDIDVNKPEYMLGRIALMLASLNGHKEIVQLLLQHKYINVNQLSTEGWTALMWASEKGRKEIVQLLLDQKDINVNIHDPIGRTALFEASSNGHKEIVQLLLEHKDIQNVNQLTIWGWTALLWASQKEYTEVVQLLLQHRYIDVNQQGKTGRTALHEAAVCGHKKIVRLLKTLVSINS